MRRFLDSLSDYCVPQKAYSVQLTVSILRVHFSVPLKQVVRLVTPDS
jgi:hypothetical protein